MKQPILIELERFVSDYGLSADRAGKVLVNNGRLIERLRNNRRIWPDTEKKVRAAIARERKARGIPKNGGAAQ